MSKIIFYEPRRNQSDKCINCNHKFRSKTIHRKAEKILSTPKGNKTKYYCLDCAETLNLIGDE